MAVQADGGAVVNINEERVEGLLRGGGGNGQQKEREEL